MWARFVSLITGLWLMAAPDVLSYPKQIADNNHIVGPIIVTFSTIAIWECTRNMRWWNLPFGIWLIFGPWVLSYDVQSSIMSDFISGIVVLLSCLVKTKRKEHFAGGWQVLFRN